MRTRLRRTLTMRTKSAAVPYVFWMALFVVVPLVLIVVYAFTTMGAYAADICYP